MNGLNARDLVIGRAGKALSGPQDLSFEAGQCWGILGPNGVGKTTLLLTLAGLLAPQSGGISLHGEPLGDWPRRRLARQLGVVLQEPPLAFPATVEETVLQGRHPHLSPWSWESPRDLEIAHTAMDRLGLSALAQRPLEQLSGGERQRVAIATLLTQDPAFLLLDEPVNHLDLPHQLATLELLRSLAGERGKCVVVVMHDVNLVQRYCDHAVCLLDRGQWLSGPTQAVLSAANLSNLYGHPLMEIPGPHGPLFVPE